MEKASNSGESSQCTSKVQQQLRPHLPQLRSVFVTRLWDRDGTKRVLWADWTFWKLCIVAFCIKLPPAFHKKSIIPTVKHGGTAGHDLKQQVHLWISLKYKIKVLERFSQNPDLKPMWCLKRWSVYRNPLMCRNRNNPSKKSGPNHLHSDSLPVTWVQLFWLAQTVIRFKGKYFFTQELLGLNSCFHLINTFWVWHICKIWIFHTTYVSVQLYVPEMTET